MYLSDKLLTFIFESGNMYIASLDEHNEKIKLFWEEDEGGYTCFTAFDVKTEGSWKPLKQIEEQSVRSITAHKLEPKNTLSRVAESGNPYPPD